MGEENGSHVTWRELNLVLGPMRSDITEMKGDVKLLLSANSENAGRRKYREWLTLLIVGLFSGGLATAVLALWP